MTGIQLQFYSNHNGNMFGEITDDHIRAIVERANALGLLGGKLQLLASRDPMPEIKFGTWMDQHGGMSTAPADDEATFNAMWDAYESERPEEGKAHERAIQAQIDKIRRGEIPGLTTSEAEEKLAQALLKRIAQNTELLFENQSVKDERDTLKAQAETAEFFRLGVLSMASERDAAIARADEHLNARSMMTKACEEATSQRDTARAAHAEAMGLLKYIDGNYDMADYCRRLDDDIKDYLAKYGKDASK